MSPRRAPNGELSSYAVEPFTADALTLQVFRKGAGPAVLVLTEIPGITPHVLGFADRLVGMGLTAVVPDLFGTAGRDPEGPGRNGYMAKTFLQLCVRREFLIFATRRTSPVVDWLRALGHAEHQRCGGPGIGVVGMCFTGGFALAMATEPEVLAPVLSQPGIPPGLTAAHRKSIGCSDEDLEKIAGRCSAGLQVLGLRFEGDPLVPEERFAALRERLGSGFVAVELKQADGHPKSPLAKHHSVLTGSLIDEPGQPTWEALRAVLELFRSRLLA